MWIVIITIVVLLLLSAFFSGSETALTAASHARMHQLAEQGDRRAQMVLSLVKTKEKLIGTILLGNNLVNILASAIATQVLLGLFGGAGVVYATLGMTLLLLIFSEVMPKTYALGHADRVALVVAPILKVVVFILGPIATFIRTIVHLTLRLFGAKVGTGHNQEEKEEELRGAIALHENEDPDSRKEREMLSSILDLDDVEVMGVMTHRQHVEMIDLEDSVEANLEKILASPYTRLPLYRDDPDNILGVIHAKAVLQAIYKHKGPINELDLEVLGTKPWFIPDTASLLDQLEKFRRKRKHFAIVIDEYGASQGIVTLEDILEVIVGDIDDEHDIELDGIVAQDDGSYIIEGTTTIRSLNRRLLWKLPDDDASTIAGLLMHEARIIPNTGQVFMFFGYRFEVLKRQRQQIMILRVTSSYDDKVNEDVDGKKDAV